MTERPMRLRPDLRRRLWGGDHLTQRLGVTPPDGDEPVAEAWLAYGESRIDGGSHDGRTVADVIADAPEAIVGAGSLQRYGPIMPLLVKYLDAAQNLSVQVHPDDDYALRRHPGSGHLGKTESWRILQADPSASVAWGFVRPVTPEELRRATTDGSVAGLLRSVRVRPGDVVHNPAGTVHAIGAGLTVYELQQASDLTYRMWDHGRPRELHLDDALAVADRSGAGEPMPDPQPGPDGWTTRVACPFYRLDEAGADRGATTGRIDVQGDTGGAMHLLTLPAGRATLEGPFGREVMDERATWLLPAALGRYRVTGEGLLLRGRVAS